MENKRLAIIMCWAIALLASSCSKSQETSPTYVPNENEVSFYKDSIAAAQTMDTLGMGESRYITHALGSLNWDELSVYEEVHTTINRELQDTATQVLLRQLQEIDANWGTVIVMETKTGDIKAMVNLDSTGDSIFGYSNFAMEPRIESGSTFKTASLMVALEDGVATPETTVDTGNGLYTMHGAIMKDWSYGGKGGFGLVDVKTILEQSSNIGVSRIIDEGYGSDPIRFINGLDSVGMGVPFDIPFVTHTQPRMKQDPNDPEAWSATTLPWMSIGYESLLAPIHTCTFYNGIANGGRMVAPRLVKAVKAKGKDYEELPVQVVREQMCSQKTLGQVHDMLENVVSATSGTGKKAQCEGFKVCGKTGTAQMAMGSKGYANEQIDYFLSFCGYFPAEAPRYTCFVGIQKTGLPASGGGHCGPVFRQIAEYMERDTVNK